MKNELISMADFVLAIKFEVNDYLKDANNFLACRDYTNFLIQPLNIGMFVPAIEVNGKWEVLEEPQGFKYFNVEEGIELTTLGLECRQFQQAKNNVLFERFEIYSPKNNSYKLSVKDKFGNIVNFSLKYKAVYPNKTIQDLIKYKPTLTERGMKLAGYEQ